MTNTELPSHIQYLIKEMGNESTRPDIRANSLWSTSMQMYLERAAPCRQPLRPWSPFPNFLTLLVPAWSNSGQKLGPNCTTWPSLGPNFGHLALLGPQLGPILAPSDPKPVHNRPKQAQKSMKNCAKMLINVLFPNQTCSERGPKRNL